MTLSQYHADISDTPLKLIDRPEVDEIVKIIAAAQHGQPINEEDYVQHMSAMAAIPVSDRDVRWLEASVLLNAACKQQAKETFYRMAQIRNIYLTGSALEEFAKFYVLLESVLFPHTLGSHGYILRLDRMNSDRVLKKIRKSVEFIEGTGRAVFLNSGTLLGAVREGGLISYDDDIDICVLIAGCDAASRAEDWADLRAALRDQGILNLNKEANSNMLATAKLRKSAGVVVDIFPGWIEDDRVYIWPHTFGELSTSDVLPLQKIALHGVDFPAPKEAEKMLAVNYGPDWRNPDPTWQFPWKAARKRFRPFIKACLDHPRVC